MNRNQAKEFYPILQAFAEGRVIECRTKPSAIEGTDVPNDWTEIKEIEFWKNTEYRIKPEPTYRPFKDAEECWQEMKKHQPFGWTKLIGEIEYSLITDVDDTINYSDAIKEYTFADGTQKLQVSNHALREHPYYKDNTSYLKVVINDGTGYTVTKITPGGKYIGIYQFNADNTNF